MNTFDFRDIPQELIYTEILSFVDSLTLIKTFSLVSKTSLNTLNTLVHEIDCSKYGSSSLITSFLFKYCKNLKHLIIREDEDYDNPVFTSELLLITLARGGLHHLETVRVQKDARTSTVSLPQLDSILVLPPSSSSSEHMNYFYDTCPNYQCIHYSSDISMEVINKLRNITCIIGTGSTYNNNDYTALHTLLRNNALTITETSHVDAIDIVQNGLCNLKIFRHLDYNDTDWLTQLFRLNKSMQVYDNTIGIISNNMAKAIAENCPQFRYLNVNDGFVENDVFKYLGAACPDLNYIDMVFASDIDEKLKYLTMRYQDTCVARNIQTLHITESSESDELLINLFELQTSLKVLTLSDVMSRDRFDTLAPYLQNLEELHMSPTDLDTYAVAYMVSQLPKLKKLTFWQIANIDEELMLPSCMGDGVDVERIREILAIQGLNVFL